MHLRHEMPDSSLLGPFQMWDDHPDNYHARHYEHDILHYGFITITFSPFDHLSVDFRNLFVKIDAHVSGRMHCREGRKGAFPGSIETFLLSTWNTLYPGWWRLVCVGWDDKWLVTKLRLFDRHVPRSQKDPRSWISRIQDLGSWKLLDLIFSFSDGILEILDPVTATLPWDHRDLGSRTEELHRILGILDPAWAGCRGILQILDRTRQLCHCILNILYIQWNFASGSSYLCAA